MDHRHLFLLSTLTLVTAACASPSAEERVGGNSDELAADRGPIPTTHTTLTAGDPYSPVLDERPLEIAGTTSCLDAPRVVITPGTTGVEATILATRRELLQRLDLGVEGVPINVRQLAGATGTARLAVETKMTEGAMTLMFQAKGSFESTLTGLGAEPPPFNSARIAKCGWGYVKKAYHRLSAVVMVTIESSDGMSRVRLGCGEGEENCSTGISAGPIQAKLSLERMLQEGSFNISLRSVADAIPGLAPAPFGSMVALSSTPETAADVMKKLSSALDWLGGAQATIAEQLNVIQANPTKRRAPTTKVEFVYYPGLSADSKDALARSFDELIALRNDYDVTLSRAATWEAFGDARSEGHGHTFNVPGSPAQTVEELDARAAELLGDTGLVATRRQELESSLSRCEDAGRGGIGTNEAAVDRVRRGCQRLAGAAWDAGYQARYGLRRLAPVSMKVRSYDEWSDNMCPQGQRIPAMAEAALLGPWSQETARELDRGIFLRRGSFLEKAVWLKAGKTEHAGLFQSPEQVSMCFSAKGSLFE